jgi:hypothetical protein
MVIYDYFQILRILSLFRRTQTISKEQTNFRFGIPRSTGPPVLRVVRGISYTKGPTFHGAPINVRQVLLDICSVDVIYILSTIYNHITLRLRHHYKSGTVVIMLTVTFSTCAGDPADKHKLK